MCRPHISVDEVTNPESVRAFQYIDGCTIQAEYKSTQGEGGGGGTTTVQSLPITL
eukprot:m.344041 g.344041  ORF g.344041 m.344041 type:complete len:55 (-) comp27876_c0_seq3:108-272(-)